MDGGKNQKWMTILRDYIIEHRFHHTFWCINPNSGDTGGLVGNDWSTWDEAKYGLLKKALWQDSNGKFIGLDHRVPLGKNGVSLGEHYGMDNPPITPPPHTQTPTPNPTPTPTPIEDFIYGDINDDGLVNSVDYMLLTRIILEIPVANINEDAGDVNRDGKIDTRDAIILSRYLLEIIDSIPMN
jgi:hypothetical protein